MYHNVVAVHDYRSEVKKNSFLLLKSEWFTVQAKQFNFRMNFKVDKVRIRIETSFTLIRTNIQLSSNTKTSNRNFNTLS